MRLITTVFPLFLAWTCTHGAEKALQLLMSEMEGDALDFARAVEEAYTKRCDPDTIQACAAESYHSCLSEFANATCPGGDLFGNPMCGGGTCAGFVDFTTTAVALATNAPGGLGEDDIPLGNMTKEAVCYTLQAEPYMVEKFQSFNVGATNGMFFGSDTTAVRMIPARHLPMCGGYDPTRRPWYVAATSGPKDVILIMDMPNNNVQARNSKPDLVKAAAKRIVETLTVADHVAVVTLDSESPSLIGGNKMIQATRENRGRILDAIESANRANPRPVENLLEQAYDLIVESHANEHTSFCHSAIVYLTDGSSLDSQKGSVGDITTHIEQLNERVKVRPYHFLYNVGLESTLAGSSEVLQQVACRIGGLWARIKDQAGLALAMSGYYKLFSLGLGDNENEGFVAWVDPYPYVGGDIMGTTVSAPVYDKSVSPPVLLGAVGIDFTMAAMDEALGVDSGNRKTLDRLVQRSTAICPKLNLTQCEIQSLRIISGGEESLCPGECTDFVGIKPQPCSSQSDYPTEFWENMNNKGRSYLEQTCCSIGETRSAGQLNLKEVQTSRCVVEATTQIETEMKGETENEATTASSEANKAQMVGFIIAAVAGVVVVGVGVMIYNIKVTSPAR